MLLERLPKGYTDGFLEFFCCSSAVILFVFRVSDEKEARGYLQALANRMTEELEGLKSSGYATIPRVCATS